MKQLTWLHWNYNCYFKISSSTQWKFQFSQSTGNADSLVSKALLEMVCIQFKLAKTMVTACLVFYDFPSAGTFLCIYPTIANNLEKVITTSTKPSPLAYGELL